MVMQLRDKAPRLAPYFLKPNKIYSVPVGGIKLKMNFHETYWVPGISVEDAGEGVAKLA